MKQVRVSDPPLRLNGHQHRPPRAPARGPPSPVLQGRHPAASAPSPGRTENPAGSRPSPGLGFRKGAPSLGGAAGKVAPLRRRWTSARGRLESSDVSVESPHLTAVYPLLRRRSWRRCAKNSRKSRRRSSEVGSGFPPPPSSSPGWLVLPADAFCSALTAFVQELQKRST